MKIERKESNTHLFYEIKVGEMFEFAGTPYLKVNEQQAFDFTTNDIDDFDTEIVVALNAKVVIE